MTRVMLLLTVALFIVAGYQPVNSQRTAKFDGFLGCRALRADFTGRISKTKFSKVEPEWKSMVGCQIKMNKENANA